MPVVGIGTDIVEIERLEKSLEKSDSLARRILTDAEYDDFQKLAKLNEVLTRDTSEDRSLVKQGRFLAKRFAAKEAAVKAIGNGIGNGVSWQQMEIAHHQTGQPYLQVSGRLKELFALKNVQHSHVSISDEQTYAVATVLLES